jgi:hypothetical protein
MTKERKGLRSGFYNTRSKKSILEKNDKNNKNYNIKKTRQYILFKGSHILYRKNKLQDIPNSWYIKFGPQRYFFGGKYKKKYEIIPVSKKFIKKTYIVGENYKFNNLIKKVLKDKEWTLVSSIFNTNISNNINELPNDQLSIHNRWLENNE